MLVLKRDPLALPALNSLFRDFFTNDPLATFAPAERDGILAVDISEDDANVYIRASLPGFRREDVAVEMDEDAVSIRAERSEETEDDNERYRVRERRFGSVHRQFTLPAGVDSQNATAQLKDGVLTLTMPKTAGATPQRIEVA